MPHLSSYVSYLLPCLISLFLRLLLRLPPYALSLSPGASSLFLCPPGRSSLFPFEDGFLDDGHGDPSLTPGLNSPTRCQNGERMERYSRKVFVGGLPPDIDEGGSGGAAELGVSAKGPGVLCSSTLLRALCSHALLGTHAVLETGTGTSGRCTWWFRIMG